MQRCVSSIGEIVGWLDGPSPFVGVSDSIVDLRATQFTYKEH